ncbi:MAG: hypothetical protein QME28_05255 [Candidatus Saccharicenans sp.]|nr:hypothetical protein [Candidatus Saccharicenans sp.]
MFLLIKTLINKQIGRINLPAVLIFTILAGSAFADTSVSGTFSVELREWLVLEINSGIQAGADRGSGSVSVMTEIKKGQPVFVRALLSAGHSRMVVLKGRIQKVRQDVNNQSHRLFWSGEGDLSGKGVVHFDQETTFAVWRGQGYKAGSLNFYSSVEGNEEDYLAVFYLSAI